MPRYQKWLLVFFIPIWLFLGIHPVSRPDWFLENIPFVFAITALILLARGFKLSNFSFTLIIAYLILPAIGSHYSVAGVPFGRTLGGWLHTTRDMFDRLEHFSFGFLLAYPFHEMFNRISRTHGFWSYWIPFEITLAFSALYEIFEWIIATNIDPATATIFLGIQGDIWDSQKDMGMAATGAAITMIVLFVVNTLRKRAATKRLVSTRTA